MHEQLNHTLFNFPSFCAETPHSTTNYSRNDLMLLPHLHMTHWHQMWSAVCIRQLMEFFKKQSLLKTPQMQLKGKMHLNVYWLLNILSLSVWSLTASCRYQCPPSPPPTESTSASFLHYPMSFICVVSGFTCARSSVVVQNMTQGFTFTVAGWVVLMLGMF